MKIGPQGNIELAQRIVEGINPLTKMEGEFVGDPLNMGVDYGSRGLANINNSEQVNREIQKVREMGKLLQENVQKGNIPLIYSHIEVTPEFNEGSALSKGWNRFIGGDWFGGTRTQQQIQRHQDRNQVKVFPKVI